MVQQHNFYCPKKQPQKKSQRKCLEPVLEIDSVSDEKNNTRSSEAEQISIISDRLNIHGNRQPNNQPTTENAPAKVPLTTQPIDSVIINDSSLLDQNLEENLDDSIILIETKISVIEVLEDSIEDTISSMNFSSLSTDDSTDEECDDPENFNPKIAWSSQGNVRSVVNQQEYIKHKVVDTLFDGNPMTVNLYELFPDIEPELTIRRRSSVHWTTPPLYSMLPKY